MLPEIETTSQQRLGSSGLSLINAVTIVPKAKPIVMQYRDCTQDLSHRYDGFCQLNKEADFEYL